MVVAHATKRHRLRCMSAPLPSCKKIGAPVWLNIDGADFRLVQLICQSHRFEATLSKLGPPSPCRWQSGAENVAGWGPKCTHRVFRCEDVVRAFLVVHPLMCPAERGFIWGWPDATSRCSSWNLPVVPVSGFWMVCPAGHASLPTKMTSP